VPEALHQLIAAALCSASPENSPANVVSYLEVKTHQKPKKTMKKQHENHEKTSESH
jgi:hypothetical protein